MKCLVVSANISFSFACNIGRELREDESDKRMRHTREIRFVQLCGLKNIDLSFIYCFGGFFSFYSGILILLK